MPEIIDGIYLHAYMTEGQISVNVNKDREIVYVSDWDISTYVPGTDGNLEAYTPAYEIDIGGGTIIRRNIVTWEALAGSGYGVLRYIEDGETLGVIRSKDPDSSRGAITGYTEGEFSFILGDYVKAEGQYGNFVHGFNSFIKGPFSSMAQSIGNYNVVDNHPQSGIFGGWNNMIGLAKVRFVVKSKISAEPAASTDIFHDLFVVESPFDTFSVGEIVWWEGGVLTKGAFPSSNLSNGDIIYSIDDEAYYELSGGAFVQVIPTAPPSEANDAQFDSVLGGYQNVIYGDQTSASVIIGGTQNKLGSTIGTNRSVQFSSIIGSELSEIDYSVADDEGYARNNSILNSTSSTIKGTAPGWGFISNSILSDIFYGATVTGGGGFTNKLYRIDNSYQSTITGGPGSNYEISNSENSSLTFDNVDVSQFDGPYYRHTSIHDSEDSSITNHSFSRISNSYMSTMTSGSTEVVVTAVTEGPNLIESSHAVNIENFVKFSAIRNSANSDIKGLLREYVQDTPNNFIQFVSIEGSDQSTIYADTKFSKIEYSNNSSISGALHTPPENASSQPVYSHIAFSDGNLSDGYTSIDKSGYSNISYSWASKILESSWSGEITHSEKATITGKSAHSSIRQSYQALMQVPKYSVIDNSVGVNLVDQFVESYVVSNLIPLANQPTNLERTTNNSKTYYTIAGSGWPEDANSNGKQIGVYDGEFNTWSYLTMSPGRRVQYESDLGEYYQFDKVDVNGDNVWVSLYNANNVLVNKHNRIEASDGSNLISSAFSYMRGESLNISGVKHASIMGGKANAISFQEQVTVTVSAITFSGTTATASTLSPHGLTTNNLVIIGGVTGPDAVSADLYNGAFLIAVVDDYSFTYTMRGTPSGNATAAVIQLVYNIYPEYATIINGLNNTISGLPNGIAGGYQLIGGGLNNKITSPDAAILHGQNNIITTSESPSIGYLTSSMSNISGGIQNAIVGAPAAHIGGGLSNTVVDYVAGAYGSSISGGQGNVIEGSGTPSFIGGGQHNHLGVIPLTTTRSGIRLISGASGSYNATAPGKINIGSGYDFPFNITPQVNDAVRFTENYALKDDAFDVYLYVDGQPATSDKIYYIESYDGTSITLSLTSGGPAVTITENGTGLVAPVFSLAYVDVTQVNMRPIASAVISGYSNFGRGPTTFIGGGASNVIDKADMGVIIMGDTNKVIWDEFATVAPIGTTNAHSTIVNGLGNEIINSSYSTILSGEYNTIIPDAINGPTDYSVILSGLGHTIQGSVHSLIGAGNGNKVGKTSINSATITGLDLVNVNATTAYNVIINGFTSIEDYGNRIYASSFSFIGNGDNNIIWGENSSYSTISNGFRNANISGTGGFIGAGQFNRISGLNTEVPNCVLYNAGSEYEIELPYKMNSDGTEHLLVVGDYVKLTLTGGVGSTDISTDFWYIITNKSDQAATTRITIGTIGPADETLYNVITDPGTAPVYTVTPHTENAFAAIVNGDTNFITSSSSFIGSGSENRIGVESSFGAIVTGNSNFINKSSESFIGSGAFNSIINTAVASIVGGNYNSIYNDELTVDGSTTGGHCAIVSGHSNQINSTARYQFIGAGLGNIIKSPEASIVGGIGNYITNGTTMDDDGILTPTESSSGGVISGGYYNSLVGVSAGGIYSGVTNVIVDEFATANNSFIGGGFENIISAPGGRNSILGGTKNNIGTKTIAYLDESNVDTAADTISTSAIGVQTSFDASADVNVGSDEITLSDASGFVVDMEVMLTIVSGSLPTPLAESTIYKIETVNYNTNVITLKDELDVHVDITATGSGTTSLFEAGVQVRINGGVDGGQLTTSANRNLQIDGSLVTPDRKFFIINNIGSTIQLSNTKTGTTVDITEVNPVWAYDFALMTVENTVYNAESSAIIAGELNAVRGFGSTVVSGSLNVVDIKSSAILAGTQNIITYTGTTYSDGYSVIGGGISNTIEASGLGVGSNMIGAGFGNKIIGPNTGSNFIGAGTENVIEAGEGGAILAGVHNYITRSEVFPNSGAQSAIILTSQTASAFNRDNLNRVASGNEIVNTSHGSIIGGGTSHRIWAALNSSILSGWNNTIINSGTGSAASYGVIGSGQHNGIGASNRSINGTVDTNGITILSIYVYEGIIKFGDVVQVRNTNLSEIRTYVVSGLEYIDTFNTRVLLRDQLISVGPAGQVNVTFDTFSAVIPVGTGDLTVANVRLYSPGDAITVTSGTGTLDSNLVDGGVYTIDTVGVSTITLLGVTAAGDGVGTNDIAINGGTQIITQANAQCDSSGILSGYQNNIYSSTSSITGGTFNIIDVQSTNSSVVGGYSNVISPYIDPQTDTFDAVIPVGTGDLTVGNVGLYSPGYTITITAGTGTLDSNLVDGGVYTIDTVGVSTITLLGVTAAGDGVGTNDIAINEMITFDYYTASESTIIGGSLNNIIGAPVSLIGASKNVTITRDGVTSSVGSTALACDSVTIDNSTNSAGVGTAGTTIDNSQFAFVSSSNTVNIDSSTSASIMSSHNSSITAGSTHSAIIGNSTALGIAGLDNTIILGNPTSTIDTSNTVYMHNLVASGNADIGGNGSVLNIKGTDEAWVSFFPNGSTRLGYFGFASNTDENLSWVNESSTGILKFGTNGAVRMTIDSSGNTDLTGDLDVGGTLSKSAGTFKIDHPVPEKSDTHNLYHSFVESPNAGDNLYTYVANAKTDGETVNIELPDYWNYLNENPRIFIQAKGIFAHAFGKVNGNVLEITCEKSGDYDVLLIGTRKDKAVLKYWKGVEREK